MAELTPYPWQMAPWRRLQQQRQRDRLPHALLLYGQPGLGLAHFATCFIQSLACREPGIDGIACGECPACRQFRQGVYPDFRGVGLEDDKTAILVDQIRELNEFLGLTHGSGALKLAMLSPADRMNANAANSLLKTLEEPSGDAMIVLVAHSLNRLPATIRSRCQLVKFVKPSRDEARQWLAERGCEPIDQLLLLANGAPCLAERLNDAALLERHRETVTMALEALERRRSVPELRKNFAKTERAQLLDWLQTVLRDLQRAFHPLPDARFENPDQVPLLRRLAGLLDSKDVFDVSDRFVKMAAVVDHPLNAELFLDDLIQTWLRLGKG